MRFFYVWSYSMNKLFIIIFPLILLIIMISIFAPRAFSAGTLDEELEKNKEALKEFKTLSDYEKCLYLRLNSCDAYK